MRGQWALRERIHLCVHLPAIHAYTNPASSIANRRLDSNSYTYLDTETFTGAEASSDSALSPVAYEIKSTANS
jgi:hypothetical protein